MMDGGEGCVRRFMRHEETMLSGFCLVYVHVCMS